MTHAPAWQDAIAYALAHETPWPRDPHAAPGPGQQPFGVHPADPPPYNVARGPLQLRGGVAGVVWQRGQEVAAWGDADRADQTFSVAKTCLGLLAGLAQGQGLLLDVDATVASQLPGIGFDSTHNRPVTWRMLLEQTSEWEGSCFGLPDTVDRWRRVAHDPNPPDGAKGAARPLRVPGTYWEYNDVRINQLSLALMHLFAAPLPQVFALSLMNKLGASQDWRWQGYDDAYTDVRGVRMQSVPGGTHWGAGLSISARDMTRLGQLMLDGGRCGGEQLIPAAWAQRMLQPSTMAAFYGWLMWLNPLGKHFPGASAQAAMMVGAGGHMVWVEPAHQAVVVVRWLDGAHTEGFMQRAGAALAAG